MGKFSDYLSRKLSESKKMNMELAEYLGCNSAYVTMLLKRPTPPDPKNTDIHSKLDSFFNEPAGTFAKYAILDLYDLNLLKNAVSANEAKAILNQIRKKAVQPHVIELLDEIEKIPENDRTELISFLLNLAQLDKDTLRNLENVVRPFVEASGRKLRKDAQKKVE